MNGKFFKENSVIVDYQGVEPKRKTDNAGAFDLISYCDDCILQSGETRAFSTNLKIALPKNCVGLVLSRSGLALENSVFVLNAPGLIDADFRGEIKVILHNAGKEDYEVKKGHRIGQLLIIKNTDAIFVLSELSNTERGENGFGSTGK